MKLQHLVLQLFLSSSSAAWTNEYGFEIEDGKDYFANLKQQLMPVNQCAPSINSEGKGTNSDAFIDTMYGNVGLNKKLGECEKKYPNKKNSCSQVTFIAWPEDPKTLKQDGVAVTNGSNKVIKNKYMEPPINNQTPKMANLNNANKQKAQYTKINEWWNEGKCCDTGDGDVKFGNLPIDNESNMLFVCLDPDIQVMAGGKELSHHYDDSTGFGWIVESNKLQDSETGASVYQEPRPRRGSNGAKDGIKALGSSFASAYADAEAEHNRRVTMVIGISVAVGVCLIASISFCCWKFVCSKKDTSPTPVMAKEVDIQYNGLNNTSIDPNQSNDAMYPGGVQMTGQTGQGSNDANMVGMKAK